MSTTDTNVGTEIAGYRIERLIGRGGMGMVYLAEHTRLQRNVALKILPPDLAADDNFRRRFIRESQLAASIDHPNIIQIYDAADSDGVLFIAMRYVEGSDLAALIKSEGALEFSRTISILTQVGDALDAAHGEGLVHRDVKPANILIAPGPERDHVFLSDFGLTKRGTSESHLTSSGEVLGTIDYMAPEQIEGKPIDGRADLYSLACVAYECLTGQKPYPRESDAAVLWAHMMAPIPSVRDIRDVPEEADRVVARGLSKTPDERFASGREFVTALKDELPETEGAMPAFVRARRRRRGVARLVGSWPRRVVAAVLAVALGLGVFFAVRPSPKPIDLTALANVVAALDPATGTVKTATKVGAAPSAVAFDGSSVWVANKDDGTVDVLDPKTGRTRTLGTTTEPTAIAIGEGFAWVLGGFPTSAIYPFALASGSKGTEIDLNTKSEDIAAGLGWVWATDVMNRKLLRIDPKSHDQKPIDVAGVPTGVAVGDGSVWVTIDGGTTDEVLRIDPGSLAMTPIRLSARPNGIAVGSEGVWVTEGDDGAVVTVDPRTEKAGRPTAVGMDPVRIALGGGAAWVADFEGRAVSRIDVRTSAVRTTSLGLFATGVTVGAGRAWVSANPGAAKLVSALCPSEVPIGDPTTCWTLTVPERHTDPGGPTIKLWVERIETPKSIQAAPDPVVMIGQSLAEHVSYGGNAGTLSSKTHRETIALDVRGTGLSTPKLTCPEIQRLPVSPYDDRFAGTGRTAFLDAVNACHERLVGEGIDLGAYNDVEAAEDVDDLRRAVGVPQVDFRTVGYASRIAFEVMRDFPTTVRAAWLDSPEYPQEDYFAEAASGTTEGLAALQKACSSDAACAKRYPDITGTFARAVASLNAHPVTVTVTERVNGKRTPVPVVIDSALLARFVRQDIARPTYVPAMPGDIYAAAARRFGTGPDSLVHDLLGSLRFCIGYRIDCVLPVDFADGAALSTLCHDEAPFTNRGTLPANGPFVSDFGRNPYLDACPTWDVGAAPAFTHTAVRTSVPLLLWHGEYDTYFPPSTATVGAETLQRSLVYDVNGAGYNVFNGSGACVVGIRNAWIQRPTVTPDVSCLGSLPRTITGGFVSSVGGF